MSIKFYHADNHYLIPQSAFFGLGGEFYRSLSLYLWALGALSLFFGQRREGEWLIVNYLCKKFAIRNSQFAIRNSHINH